MKRRTGHPLSNFRSLLISLGNVNIRYCFSIFMSEEVELDAKKAQETESPRRCWECMGLLERVEEMLSLLEEVASTSPSKLALATLPITVAAVATAVRISQMATQPWWKVQILALGMLTVGDAGCSWVQSCSAVCKEADRSQSIWSVSYLPIFQTQIQGGRW